MEMRQKEAIKLVKTKDKLRQNTNAKPDAKATMTTTATEMQKKHGQYTLAKKQYTIKRNSRVILYNKQTHSDTTKRDHVQPSSKIGVDINVKKTNKTSESSHQSNVFLIKKVAINLRSKTEASLVQENNYLQSLPRQENEAEDNQIPQRNAFDETNEEAIDKLYQQGRTLAQTAHEYYQHPHKDKHITKTTEQNVHLTAQVRFMRTRSAQFLHDKQKRRQVTMRQFQSVRQLLSAYQQNTALLRSEKNTNAKSQQYYMRQPTTRQMDDTMQIQNVNRAQPQNKILRRVPYLRNSTEPFINSQTLTAEQVQNKRKSAAIGNLLRKRIQSKVTAIPHMLITGINSSISHSSPIFSLTAERHIVRIARSIGRSIQSLFFSLASAGTMMILVPAFFAAFAALLFSPFGIFFSGQDDDNQTLAIAVAEINRAFNIRLDEIESSITADSIIYHRIPDDGGNNGEGRFITNWTDIAAVFAVRTASGNDTNSMDVLTIDGTRIELLKNIFNDMNIVTYDVENIHHFAEDGTDRTEKILHITITSKTYVEMSDFYNFTTAQRQALDEIMKPEYAQMLSELVGTYGNVSSGTIVITDSELQSLLAKLPTDLSPQRQEVIATAFSLVGKVNYFWGGKSHVIGWDDRWGTPTKVTAAGSRTTGTTRPFGLDCSGFVDWVFINATGTNVGQGGGAAAQYHNSLAIAWTDAKPGDLVFYPDLGHVGIICGKDDNGNLLVVHCASSQNNVVVTTLSGFTKIRRPIAFGN